MDRHNLSIEEVQSMITEGLRVLPEDYFTVGRKFMSPSV
jgi:hypothetical protein